MTVQFEEAFRAVAGLYISKKLNLVKQATPQTRSGISGMPRFAVLSHDHPFPHWDFLLEYGPSCRTWRLLKSPDSTGEIPAEVLPDHRLMYLDYEGPVSGDRGTVASWDAGTFEWLINEETAVEVVLSGRKLSGFTRLIQSKQAVWVALLATSTSHDH